MNMTSDQAITRVQQFIIAIDAWERWPTVARTQTLHHATGLLLSALLGRNATDEEINRSLSV